MQSEIVLERKLEMPAKVKGEGAPIVFVPDGLTGWHSWDRDFEFFSASRMSVSVQLISVELSTRGEALPEGYSVGMESRALRNTLEALQLSGPADIAAWSYGAEIALDLALNAPELVRTLTLIEPPALWVLGGRMPAGIAYGALRQLAGDIHGDEVSETQLEEFICSIGLCPEDASPKDLPQWPSWSANRLALRSIRAALGHSDDVARLNGFERPVLIVKGEGSAPFMHQIADALAFELRRAKLLTLPSGHAPHLVSREKFLDHMVAFQKGNI